MPWIIPLHRSKLWDFQTGTSTPPGAISWVIAPLCAVLLVIALMPTRAVKPRSSSRDESAAG